MKRQEIPSALLARIAKNVFNFYFILETMSYLLFIISSYFISCLAYAQGLLQKENDIASDGSLFVPPFLRVDSKLARPALVIHLEFSPVVFGLIRQVLTFCRVGD